MAALAKAHGFGTVFDKLAKPQSVDGIGNGSSGCSSTVTVPIATADHRRTDYTATVIDNSPVPSLLGLDSMTRQRVLLDLINDKYVMIGPGGFELKLSPGSTVLNLQRAETGHLMLPASEWSQVNASLPAGPAMLQTTGENVH